MLIILIQLNSILDSWLWARVLVSNRYSYSFYHINLLLLCSAQAPVVNVSAQDSVVKALCALLSTTTSVSIETGHLY